MEGQPQPFRELKKEKSVWVRGYIPRPLDRWKDKGKGETAVLQISSTSLPLKKPSMKRKGGMEGFGRKSSLVIRGCPPCPKILPLKPKKRPK